MFREAGYYTAHSGKWHLGGMREEQRLDRVARDQCSRPSPNQHGFEEYYSALDGPGTGEGYGIVVYSHTRLTDIKTPYPHTLYPHTIRRLMGQVITIYSHTRLTIYTNTPLHPPRPPHPHPLHPQNLLGTLSCCVALSPPPQPPNITPLHPPHPPTPSPESPRYTFLLRCVVPTTTTT